MQGARERASTLPRGSSLQVQVDLTWRPFFRPASSASISGEFLISYHFKRFREGDSGLTTETYAIASETLPAMPVITPGVAAQDGRQREKYRSGWTRTGPKCALRS
jgi:hypothetical protein